MNSDTTEALTRTDPLSSEEIWVELAQARGSTKKSREPRERGSEFTDSTPKIEATQTL